MKKGIIITGPPESGKSTKAREIASQFPQECVTWISGRDNGLNSRFAFRDCTEKTECIIVDDINDTKKLELFIGAITGSILVNKPYQHAFEIKPKIILVYDGDISESIFFQCASVVRRFDLIHCQRNSLESLGFQKNTKVINGLIPHYRRGNDYLFIIGKYYGPHKIHAVISRAFKNHTGKVYGILTQNSPRLAKYDWITNKELTLLRLNPLSFGQWNSDGLEIEWVEMASMDATYNL
ncbi:MAG: hypothetical protein ACYC1Q_07690 [Bacteroidia bacterium]